MSKVNYSRLGLLTWAGRSRKERSAISKNIWASRKRNTENYAVSIVRQRNAMKSSWADPVQRAKRIAGIKRKWQDKKSKAHRLHILRTLAAPKIIKTLKGRIPHPNSHCTPQKVLYDGVNGRVMMRNKSEVNYAKLLDSKGTKWLYEATTFSFGRRSWTPDFYLPKQKKFVEIKGWLPTSIAQKIKYVITHFSSTRFELRNSKDFKLMEVA